MRILCRQQPAPSLLCAVGARGDAELCLCSALGFPPCRTGIVIVQTAVPCIGFTQQAPGLVNYFLYTHFLQLTNICFSRSFTFIFRWCNNFLFLKRDQDWFQKFIVHYKISVDWNTYNKNEIVYQVDIHNQNVFIKVILLWTYIWNELYKICLNKNKGGALTRRWSTPQPISIWRKKREYLCFIHYCITYLTVAFQTSNLQFSSCTCLPFSK